MYIIDWTVLQNRLGHCVCVGFLGLWLYFCGSNILQHQTHFRDLGVRFLYLVLLFGADDFQLCAGIYPPKSSQFAPETWWLVQMKFLLKLPFFRVYVSFKEWLLVVFLELRFCRSSLSLLLLESTNLTFWQ